MEQTFGKIVDLIYSAKQRGVDIVLNGGNLQLKVAEKTPIDQKLLETIRANKESIIEFLSNSALHATEVEENEKKIISFNRETIQHIPLSFAQERLVFIDRFEKGAYYHGQVILRLKGDLNEDALTFALKSVVDRHEILRTNYYEEEGQFYQRVNASNDWRLNKFDAVSLSVIELNLRIRQLADLPFSLENDYIFRAALLKISGSENILVVTIHHIASDAWSLPLIIKEVTELYSSFEEGRSANLLPLPLQYADFAVWQKNYLTGVELQKKLRYWKTRLQDVEPLQLPYDFPRPAARSSRGASTFVLVDKKTATGLNELSRKNGCSLYMVLLAAFKVLLQRYSGQNDICVGTSIANRQQQEIEGLIGFFVNTLALRTEVSPIAKFLELLLQVKDTTIGAYEHQEVPFEKVVENVLKDRDPGRTPLFQVMLVLLNTPEAPQFKLGGLQLFSESVEVTSAKFDLTVIAIEGANGLKLNAEYNTDLFSQQTIQQMLGHFTNILQSVVADPQQKVGLLSMMSLHETTELLNSAQNIETYDDNTNVVAVFEAQVLKNPNGNAIVFQGSHLSYRSLNEKSNQLAHFLRSNDIGAKSLVPICMERGLGIAVAILGILKAGAAYVPLDVDFPAQRTAQILADIQPKVLITDRENDGKIVIAKPQGTLKVFLNADEIVNQPTGNLSPVIGGSHPAYVIYTSGSTGKPKGVSISNRALIDYVWGLRQKIAIDQCTTFALMSTIATDLGNTVVYGSLLTGGELHIFTREQVSNVKYLQQYFDDHTIDCMKIVPVHWQALSMDHDLLVPRKLLVFGGDVLPSSVVNKIKQKVPGCEVINHYGPTETTIGKLLYRATGSETLANIPIGKPFGNTRVYVLNSLMQLCPVGVPGQLFIAGHGVATGYYNNEAVTREKFIANPFSNGVAEFEKMYATGDLVRFLADGNIEFLGRVDDQVKIRGYRIEPGEIECCLNAFSGISQSKVVAQNGKATGQSLLAYVVTNLPLDKEKLTAFLRERLPEFMLPSTYIELDELPLTPNGKINKKALPDPVSQINNTNAYQPAETDVQKQLVTIWQNILEVDPIGINDDFFELGGHSLMAVRLIAAIRKQFNIELPISHVFDFPSISLLSAELSITEPKATVPGKGFKALIPIKVGGSRPPLYIVSGTGGTAFTFKKFAGLLNLQQPVFGLQQADTKQQGEIADSIEKIAEKYIEEILQYDNQGPYYLAGHCVGGVIAFEMAKQLEKKGKKVSLLALIDTLIRKREQNVAPALNNLYQLPKKIELYIKKVLFKLEFEFFLLIKHPKKSFQYKLEKLKKYYNDRLARAQSNFTPEGLDIFNEYSDIYRNALRRYEITPYDGKVVAFYAKEHYFFLDKSKNIGFKKFLLNDEHKYFWKQYSKTIDIFEVDGEHSMMFDHANAGHFAALLQQYLDNDN